MAVIWSYPDDDDEDEDDGRYVSTVHKSFLMCDGVLSQQRLQYFVK